MKQCLYLLLLLSISGSAFADSSPDADSIARGKYNTIMMGCNDCHTAGYALSGGKVPESEWLKGDPLGYRGPWGTTYPMNLRLFLSKFTEEQWMSYARVAKPRPIMPAYLLSEMKEQDLRDIYRFIRSLGSAGVTMPTYLPPNVEPTTPYISFNPIIPGKAQAPAH